jgi:transposase
MTVSRDAFAALVGIDWADRKHDVCLKPVAGGACEFVQVEHRPEALDAWAYALRDRFAGQRIAVCLEQRKGPLIYALLKYEFLVLFPVNPQTLARIRRAFKTSRAKDDPTDAAWMVELLERHPDKLTAWQPDTAAVRQLRLLVEMRRTAVAERVRITNRLTAALKCYFPQVLDWFEDKATPLLCDFLTRWPDLATVQRARKSSLEQFFHMHNVRYRDVVARRLHAIAQAKPLTTDAAVTLPYRLLVNTLVPQLASTLKAIEQFDEAIAQCFATLPDAGLFRALPGAGPQLAPRLLAAFGSRREYWPEATGLLQYTGIAPVTERSGNKYWVHWPYSCPTFLRQTFVEWAGQSTLQSFWAKAFYQQQRSKGKPHAVAIRALAFKWIRILHRCWLDRVPYDESRYLMALQKKGSPLLAGLLAAQNA